MKNTIIEDYLDNVNENNICNFFTSNSIQWFNSSIDINSNEKTFYFQHKIYENFAPCSDYFKRIINLVLKINPKSIIKSTLYFFPYQENTSNSFEFKSNLNFPTNIAIYNLNDNNGHTIINNEKIENKKNRIILSELTDSYSETTCTDKKGKVNLVIYYI